MPYRQRMFRARRRRSSTELICHSDYGSRQSPITLSCDALMGNTIDRTATVLLGFLGRQVYGASGHSVAHETVRFHSGVNAGLLTVTGFRIGLTDATGDQCIIGNIPR
jgi:hypothetical protein